MADPAQTSAPEAAAPQNEAPKTDSKEKNVEKPELSKTEIFVTVRNAETVLFEGKAASITAMNAYGSFDILPRHKNFITNIESKITIHTSSTESKDIDVDSGILRIFDNTVDIFLGINTVDVATLISKDSGAVM
jgi:hypothetical protein